MERNKRMTAYKQFTLLMAVAMVAPALAQQTPVAIVGAHVIPISGPEFDNGVLVIQGGKIVSAGSVSSTKIPENAQRINASGKILMPGIIDSHSHIGSPAGGDRSSPIQADVRVLGATNVRDA